jgi:nicotinic acid mononucleotide adenylyltransferase
MTPLFQRRFDHAAGVRAAYPGTFDPPTIAHVAIAEAAYERCGVDGVDLVVNTAPLGKDDALSLDVRVSMLEAVAAPRPWLSVVVSERQLLADIAEGYDVLVLGADKWAQVVDERWYDSAAARDAAVGRLPRLAVARRHGLALPPGCIVLDVDLPHVSSTAARAGRSDLLPPECHDERR